MAAVMEMRIGNTSVVIHDDYCKYTTQEDIDRILRRIAARAKAEFGAAAEKNIQNENAPWLA